MMTKKKMLAFAAGLGLAMGVPAMAATTVASMTPTRGYYAVKQVKMTLTNLSGETLQLKIGDAVVTVDSGKSLQVSGADGALIVLTQATAKYAADTVVGQLSKQTAGGTMTIS